MQRHAQSVQIYTDGSKSALGVHCATLFPELEMFVSLPLMASIFTSGPCAIFLALTRISTPNGSSFVIYSDSLSALQALGKLYTRHALVLKIQCFLAGLHSRRKDVCLCWVPSHVGCLARKGRITWPNRPVFFRPPTPYPCLFKTSLLQSPVQSVILVKPAGIRTGLRQ